MSLPDVFVDATPNVVTVTVADWQPGSIVVNPPADGLAPIHMVDVAIMPVPTQIAVTSFQLPQLEVISLPGAQGPPGPQGPQGLQGPPGASVNWLGNWSAATAYNPNDGVNSGGSSYVCTVANTNQQPPNAAYWQLIASEGPAGPQGNPGPVGATGNTGPVGATGPAGAQGPSGATYVTVGNTAPPNPSAITPAPPEGALWLDLSTTPAPAPTPPSGAAGGDLGGNYPNPSVGKLQGQPVSTTAPTNGQVLTWNGSLWLPTTPGTPVCFGKINQAAPALNCPAASATQMTSFTLDATTTGTNAPSLAAGQGLQINLRGVYRLSYLMASLNGVSNATLAGGNDLWTMLQQNNAFIPIRNGMRTLAGYPSAGAVGYAQCNAGDIIKLWINHNEGTPVTLYCDTAAGNSMPSWIAAELVYAN